MFSRRAMQNKQIRLLISSDKAHSRISIMIENQNRGADKTISLAMLIAKIMLVVLLSIGMIYFWRREALRQRIAPNP